MALQDFPGLLFFSTYTLLVLFWAEIYHQARSLPINKLRPSYLIINVAVYAIQICIWIYVRVSTEPVAVEITKLFLAVVLFFAALGFLIYGGRLFIMLRRFPIESKGRRKKLNEVGFVTGICCTCFLIRCIVPWISRAYDPRTRHYSKMYYNHPEVQKALHTNVTGIKYQWNTCSDVVRNNWGDSPKFMLPTYKELIAAGLRIWVFRVK